LVLNTSAAIAAGNADLWFDTGPDATHVNVGLFSNVVYTNRSYIMYAWKAVAGVSAFGTYEGLGSAATNVVVNDMGFKPKWLIVKNIDGSGTWPIHDSFRNDPDVENTTYIDASTIDAEATTASYGVTFTSTGFTFDSGTTTSAMNTSGSTYIYAAFA
jgi:hypothetical protein